MALLDVAVLALVAVALFYLPFRGASLVTSKLFDRSTSRETDSTDISFDASLAETLIASPSEVAPGVPTAPRSSTEVPDVPGLIDYFALQSSGRDEVLLLELLDRR